MNTFDNWYIFIILSLVEFHFRIYELVHTVIKHSLTTFLWFEYLRVTQTFYFSVAFDKIWTSLHIFFMFIRSPSAFSRRYIFDSRTRILMAAILIQYLYEYLDRIRTITEMTPCTNPILKTKFWCPYARLKRTERQMRVRRPICGVIWELLLLEYLMRVIFIMVWIFCIDE